MFIVRKPSYLNPNMIVFFFLNEGFFFSQPDFNRINKVSTKVQKHDLLTYLWFVETINPIILVTIKVTKITKNIFSSNIFFFGEFNKLP